VPQEQKPSAARPVPLICLCARMTLRPSRGRCPVARARCIKPSNPLPRPASW
jgi:hypothetical protein